jgi:hypothetical protein
MRGDDRLCGSPDCGEIPTRSMEAYDFQGFWPVMDLGQLSKTVNPLLG